MKQSFRFRNYSNRICKIFAQDIKAGMTRFHSPLSFFTYMPLVFDLDVDLQVTAKVQAL